ncbi:hypothetical protein [Arthrobacter sp. 35/47]|uniref:hypothetical protein n=1 Tax=Arthrobacter sp. 35/47 TaxID=269454 RepID=UPI0012EBD8AC|nr:hypothetical protein [Arthrobacter sp. 35/47]
MNADVLPISQLAAPRAYAQARRGFLAPYFASERSLGLIFPDNDRLLPGENSDPKLLKHAFAGLLDLALQDDVPLTELESHPHLCLCGEQAAERAWLRSIMLSSDASGEKNDADRRSQTALMLCRLIEMYEPPDISNWLSRVLIADPTTSEDPRLSTLPIVPAWRGVVLRRWYTWAWRDLWRWLVNTKATGVVPISQLQGALADELPSCTVAEFRRSLPPGIVGGSLLDAEYDPSVASIEHSGARNFAWLVIGASRSGRLDEQVGAYFESPERERRNYELTPAWFENFLDLRNDRPLKDVSIELIGLLLARSQRIAYAKSALVNGRWKVPTRLTVRDGYAFRDADEGGGPVSLRWDQLTQVMSGLGLVKRVRDGQTSAERWNLVKSGVNE